MLGKSVTLTAQSGRADIKNNDQIFCDLLSRSGQSIRANRGFSNSG